MTSLEKRCKDANVPFFMKQLEGSAGKVLRDVGLFPRQLQVREWAKVGGRR